MSTTGPSKADAADPSLLSLLKEDLETHDGSLFETGFWAIAAHRIGHRARAARSLRAPLRALSSTLSTATDWAFGIALHPEMKLGRRVRLWHHGGLRVAARSVGNDVHLRPNTTCGPADETSEDPQTWPVIGDFADIGVGACILGNVRIGESAFVGANSLITEDIPDRRLAMGVPGRLLPNSPRAKADSSSKELRPATGTSDQNPRDLGLFALLAEDLETHGGRLSAPGFWAVALHRFGNWRMGVEQKAARVPLTLAYRAGFQFVRWFWGIDLPYDVKLGRRVRLDHHGSITLGARSIGNDVIIRHSVVTGVMRRGTLDEKPIIEDRVELGPRACVVGNVTIGHDSLICANTVVPISVPPHSTVLGVPGRIVNLDRGSTPPPRPSSPAPVSGTATPEPAPTPVRLG